MRASPRRVKDSPWLARLTQLLGNAPGTDLPFGELRYIRILLLLDPDADGIHAGALLQMFFLRTMRVLLEQGKIYIVHAPWGEIRRPGQPPLLSYHSAEFQQQCRELNATGDSSAQRIRHRGLGTLTPEVLERTCVNPATRRARALGVQDAELAASVFASELR
jgi:DNA gyrase subunit B/topoisomerase-4 subunit B